MFDMMKYEKPFDTELYRKLLKKYKTRNPEKLMDLLEDDPLLSDWKISDQQLGVWTKLLEGARALLCW